jgi:hypothetical protein
MAITLVGAIRLCLRTFKRFSFAAKCRRMRVMLRQGSWMQQGALMRLGRGVDGTIVEQKIGRRHLGFTPRYVRSLSKSSGRVRNRLQKRTNYLPNTMNHVTVNRDAQSTANGTQLPEFLRMISQKTHEHLTKSLYSTTKPP